MIRLKRIPAPLAAVCSALRRHRVNDFNTDAPLSATLGLALGSQDFLETYRRIVVSIMIDLKAIGNDDALRAASTLLKNENPRTYELTKFADHINSLVIKVNPS